MDPAIRRLIETLHASQRKCVLAMTGGGAQAAALLLNVPGGSRTVLEVSIPYHEQALIDFLGRRPEGFCTAETALEMAARAHARAGWLAAGEEVVGLGCTASLVTDRPKRGDHRFHIAVHTEQASVCHSLTLTKGARDRDAEESVLDVVLLNTLASASGISERLELPLLPGEALQTQQRPATSQFARFLLGTLPTVCVEMDGRIRADAPRPVVLLPGSFNPVHAGHWRLAEAAAQYAGGEAAFELSVTNVDKPPLSAAEVRLRAAQFAGRAPLWLTRAPTFAEKAALFPGVLFLVGADTAIRLVAPRYYQDSEARMAEALDGIRARGCRFLVAGRSDGAGRFLELEHLDIPAAYRDLFAAIPGHACRVDVSSTQFRAQAAVKIADAAAQE
jgi:hypothetical protein